MKRERVDKRKKDERSTNERKIARKKRTKNQHVNNKKENKDKVLLSLVVCGFSSPILLLSLALSILLLPPLEGKEEKAEKDRPGRKGG